MKTNICTYKGIAPILLALIIFCLCRNPLFSQDIHFSQFNFSPLNQNPALTNLFDGDFRFVGNYKNQWPTVPVRYNTFSISAESNFATLNNNDRIGGGLVFFFDRAGDSRFTSLNTALSLSYVYNFGKNSAHSLAYGIQLGLVNRSFSYDKLSFDNQWNGEQYDPNISIDESFSRTRINFFDLNMGLAYQYKKTERTNFTLGFSTSHINQPSQTFFNSKTVRLNPRFNVHTRAQVKVAAKWDIVPEVQYQHQDTKFEVCWGMHSKYYITESSKRSVALNTGIYARSTDAIWALVGVDYNQLQFNVSYDINLSALNKASRYNGGIEMSVIYILSRVKKINKPGAVCPAFL